MSKYETFKNAIETFIASGLDAPILHSTMVVNDRSFRALLGRKIAPEPWPITWLAILIFAVSSISFFISGAASTVPVGVFLPLVIIFIFYRQTLIAVRDEGLDFYFVNKFKTKATVYDKMSLPYNKITKTKVRSGKLNTYLTLEFSIDNKKYKIKTYMPNKNKKMAQQAENLKYLHDVIAKNKL